MSRKQAARTMQWNKCCRMKQESASPLSQVEVLNKAVRMLELLAVHPEGLSLTEVTRRLDLAKSSAYRLLIAWCDLGYASRLPSSSYALGFRALELARRVAKRNLPVEICHARLRRLQSESGESCYLGLYRDGSVVLVDAVESAHPLRVVVDLGEKCHLHASAQGVCVAAYLDPGSLEARVRRDGFPRITARTCSSWPHLERKLVQVRAQGYAVNEGETVENVVCLGAPLFAGEDGPVLGSAGISIPASRLTGAERKRQLKLLISACQEMTQALSGLTPEPDALSPSHVPSAPKPAGRAAAERLQ
jgi:IclR family acetate operon transcriptional repressor